GRSRGGSPACRRRARFPEEWPGSASLPRLVPAADAQLGPTSRFAKVAPMTRKSRALLLTLVVAAALALAAPAGAAIKFVRMQGVNAPGPAKYDKVGILKQGNPAADHILVLEPGTSASAAYFRLVAADI